MKYLLIILLALFGNAVSEEPKSSFLSRDIVVEYNGQKKIINDSDEIAIEDDIGEEDFRHFYIFFPFQGKIKDVELSVTRSGTVFREWDLKCAEKYIYHEDYILASDYYYYLWDFGALNAGDKIKRRYSIELKDASYGDYEPILNSIPVNRATVTIRYPVDDWSLKYCVDNGDILIESDRGEMKFEWAELPGLDDSDFEKSPLDIRPGIWYSFISKKGERDFSDWNRVHRWNREICKGTSLTDKDRDLLKIADTPENIFSTIIKECRYVAVEIDEGRFKPMSASAVWEKRHGDCKALANLFVSWLRLAGYDAWPVLVRARNSFLGNPDFPSPFQFDHEIAAFIADNGDTVYQDLTAENIPFGSIPIDHYGDFALPLIENTEPIRLPYSPREPDTIRYTISGVIDKSFELNGQVEYRSRGQRAMRNIWKARNVQKSIDRESIVKSDFESVMKGAVFDDIEEHFEGDSIIIRTAEIRKRNVGFLLDTLVILKPWIMDYLSYDVEIDSTRTWPTILRRNVVYITEYRCKLNGALIESLINNEIPADLNGFEFDMIDESHDDSLKIKTVLYLPPQILEPDDYRSYAADRSIISEMLGRGLYYTRKY